MKKKKIYSLMVLAAFFWSGAFIAGKYSVAYIPVFTLTFLRFFPAAILMYIVMKATKCPYRLNRTHVPVFFSDRNHRNVRLSRPFLLLLEIYHGHQLFHNRGYESCSDGYNCLYSIETKTVLSSGGRHMSVFCRGISDNNRGGSSYYSNAQF